ncbi:D-mannonate dehydratase ManD [Halomonas sp. Mc5H-6]|uniref:D-mannonate dehydratase ManD n=1 Tax=Halomonas sp. Mc5H-6 TaxID=2954500 RepID=UPI0020983E31|nr:D-mannonate dehydratase ManD [Halomonas sp. Mc5H-6]MCO7244738.1 D-galactonate dehydratase family protein [Halomonas sp. Mc5H-6]
MKIERAYTIVTSPGRNFVTLKIVTDQGEYGIGDATLNGREMAVVAYLEEHVIPTLIGRDPQRIEDIWHYLYRGAYWRRGPVTMTAIAAVDMALWDIKAKLAGMPLYQLLGGKSRDRVMVYGHATGRDIDACLEEVARHVDEGYKAVRIQAGVPGIASIYGVAKKDGEPYEPADADLPAEHVWSTSKYLNHVPKLFAAVRERFGDDLHVLHDVHHRLTPIEAARLGKDVEPYHLFWLEDCVPAENQEAFGLIRQHTTTPLAVGEVFNSLFDAKTLIENQWIDYIRTTLTHAGGITHVRRIADLAGLYHVRTGFHGPTDLSPVCLGAAIHFDTWVPNFGIQEYMPHTSATDEVFPHDYRFENGHFIVGETPGHGVDIDEQLAKQYPYKRASLPVNRLEDGTLWHW